VTAAPAVTVAVPVKDRRERMLRCLDALLELDYSDYEVLICDNRSTDGTAEACARHAEGSSVPVRVEVIEGSVGHVRNRAAQLGTGELIAYTDSDCMPQRGWLAGAVKPFADPEIGVVQGMTLPDPGEEVRAGSATIEVRGYTRRFESCNLIVRREAFLRTPGFDETVGHFWEDTAAGWAMLRAGWRGAFAPDAVVFHDVTNPGLGWWMRRGLRYGNASAVVRRYPEIRDGLLWHRYFTRPRTAKAAAAAVGLALAPVSRWALLLAVPYARERRPRTLDPGLLMTETIQPVLFDAAVLAGTVRESIRHRCLVL
jgi:cellulose synthase/poly-beta-1,6-N-acetylglucosamine synthase-like glycosyltransferase